MTTLRDILTAAQIGETSDWEFKSARDDCRLGGSGASAKLHPWLDEHQTIWWHFRRDKHRKGEGRHG